MNPLALALLLCLFIALILVALFGNILVCAAVFFDRKLRRQPENLFLVSLAVSDLLVSVLVMIFAAANDLLGYWPFGDAYCNFWICCDIASCTASILNLCAIAFDRYCHISRPMKYARYSSKRLICAAIFVVWLISSVVGAAQIIVGTAASDSDGMDAELLDRAEYRPMCHLRLSPMYAVFSSMLSFFLPATIMVLLYTKLYLYARMHVRSIRAQLKQATSLLIMQLASEHIRHVVNEEERRGDGPKMPLLHHSSSKQPIELQARTYDNENADDEATATAATVSGPAGAAAERPQPPRVPTVATATNAADCQTQVQTMMFPDIAEGAKRSPGPAGRSVSDQKARLTLGIIMGTFLLCWLPFFIVNIWRAFFPDFFPQWVFQAVTWLGYANSTANPIIYGTFNRDFKNAFKRIAFKLLYCWDDAHKQQAFYAYGDNS